MPPDNPNQPPNFELPGPNDQQPNSQMSDLMANLAVTLKDNKALAEGLEAVLKNVPTLTRQAAREFENLALELKVDLAHLTSMKETMKAIETFSRKAKGGLYETKNLEHAAKMVSELATGQKRIMELAGKGTKEFKEAERVLQKLVHWNEANATAIKSGGKALDMDVNKMREFQMLVESSTTSVIKLGTNIRNINVNHMTRQIHSLSKSFAEIGVGRGFSAKMDKYVAGAEIKQRVRDYKNERVTGNVAQAQDKKQQAQDWVRKNADRMGLGSGDLDFGAKGPARAAVAKRLGLRGNAAEAFLGGEEGSAVFGGGVGASAKAASAIAGGTESVIGGVAGIAAEAAPFLAVIEVLRDGFDKMVQGNKDIESAVGKAGQFAQPGTTGFMEVRRNLTPDSAYTRLGLSFERNIKIAQALQEGGRGLRELVTGEGGRAAGGEFGPGGFGGYQRIAVGAGRMAGLTDTEGIQQTLKLVDQYRATLTESEDFFIKVTKGASAAGLSTTKFISIIDDVNSHFNRMNKNLEGTLNMLTQLSKTGRIGAEDLKQYMDFLTTGGPPKSMGDVAISAFEMMNESPTLRKSRVEGAANALGQAVSTAQGAGVNVSLDQMTSRDAQKVLQKLDLDLANNKTMSPDQKQVVEGALDKLRDKASRFATIKAGGGAITQAFGQLFGMTPEELAATNQGKLENAVKIAGGTMDEFMQNPQMFGARHQAFTGALETQKLTAEDAMKAFHGRAQAATTFLAGAQGMTGMTGEEQLGYVQSARAFLKEFQKKPGGRQLLYKGTVGLTDKAIDELSPDDMEKLFKDNAKDFSNVAGGMNAITGFVQKTAMMGMDVTGDRAETLKKARMAGLQTQTTAEIFANAFSKWFNNIVGGLGWIVDHLRGITPEKRKDAKEFYDSPENRKRQAMAERMLDDQALEAQGQLQKAVESGDSNAIDVATQTQSHIEDIKGQVEDHTDVDTKGWDKLLQSITGHTASGAAIGTDTAATRGSASYEAMQSLESALRDVESGYVKSGGRTLSDAQMAQDRKLARESFDAVSSIAVTSDKTKGAFTVTPSQYTNNPEIGNMAMAGMFKGMGKDVKGNYTFIVNNYSADFSQDTSGQMLPANTAPGDHPANQGPSPQPPNKGAANGANQ